MKLSYGVNHRKDLFALSFSLEYWPFPPQVILEVSIGNLFFFAVLY